MIRTNKIQLLPTKKQKNILKEMTLLSSYCSKDNVDDRSFICKYCNHVDDRDVVGAKNILFKGMYGLESVHRDEIVPLEVTA